VPKYLVEVFVPRSLTQEAQAAGERARAAADQLSREDVAVRHVRTTFLPDDETCFHVFEAGSEESVREVCRQAGFGSPRIVPVVE
jgi:Nickel responsive protein SCO4226-like